MSDSQMGWVVLFLSLHHNDFIMKCEAVLGGKCSILYHDFMQKKRTAQGIFNLGNGGPSGTSKGKARFHFFEPSTPSSVPPVTALRCPQAGALDRPSLKGALSKLSYGPNG